MVRDQTSAVPKGRDGWILEAEGNPLDVVLEPVHYALQVTDVDGLQLERPIRGAIRIEADRRPRITASIVTQYVLPEARPRVYYHASDDYGLARLAILPEVIRDGGSPGEIDPIVVYDLPAGATPANHVKDRYRLDLAPLKLAKGDRLEIAFQAVDYRGEGRQGKATLSEPLLFQVTDKQGILAVMSDTDRESARQLQTMIDGQVDVGEGP